MTQGHSCLTRIPRVGFRVGVETCAGMAVGWGGEGSTTRQPRPGAPHKE